MDFVRNDKYFLENAAFRLGIGGYHTVMDTLDQKILALADEYKRLDRCKVPEETLALVRNDKYFLENAAVPQPLTEEQWIEVEKLSHAEVPKEGVYWWKGKQPELAENLLKYYYPLRAVKAELLNGFDFSKKTEHRFRIGRMLFWFYSILLLVLAALPALILNFAYPGTSFIGGIYVSLVILGIGVFLFKKFGKKVSIWNYGKLKPVFERLYERERELFSRRETELRSLDEQEARAEARNAEIAAGQKEIDDIFSETFGEKVGIGYFVQHEDEIKKYGIKFVLARGGIAERQRVESELSDLGARAENAARRYAKIQSSGEVGYIDSSGTIHKY